MEIAGKLLPFSYHIENNNYLSLNACHAKMCSLQVMCQNDTQVNIQIISMSITGLSRRWFPKYCSKEYKLNLNHFSAFLPVALHNLICGYTVAKLQMNEQSTWLKKGYATVLQILKKKKPCTSLAKEIPK